MEILDLAFFQKFFYAPDMLLDPSVPKFVELVDQAVQEDPVMGDHYERTVIGF